MKDQHGPVPSLFRPQAIEAVSAIDAMSPARRSVRILSIYLIYPSIHYIISNRVGVYFHRICSGIYTYSLFPLIQQIHRYRQIHMCLSCVARVDIGCPRVGHGEYPRLFLKSYRRDPLVCEFWFASMTYFPVSALSALFPPMTCSTSKALVKDDPFDESHTQFHGQRVGI